MIKTCRHQAPCGGVGVGVHSGSGLEHLSHRTFTLIKLLLLSININLPDAAHGQRVEKLQDHLQSVSGDS